MIGGFRDRYRSLETGDEVARTFKDSRPVRYKLGLPVDTSGVAPGGQHFEDLDGFRKILLQHNDQLARNLSKKLLVYATGAGIEFADRQAIDKILADTKADRYGLRSIVHSVVQSEPFQTK